MNQATSPIIKVISDSGCQSYVIGCRETRKALVIDPKVGRRSTFHGVFRDFGLEPAAVLDTHTHADHLSDSLAFHREGVPVHMSRLTTCRRPVTRLGAGDELKVGKLTFAIREVPGHTDDSLALVGHGLCVSGDSLFIGGLARADFRGSDPARLFESVTRELMTLPADTIVLPGHSYGDLLFTTIGMEKQKNAALAFEDGAAYSASLAVTEGAGNTPDVDHVLALNLDAHPELPDEPVTAAACCAAGTATGGGREREMTPVELSDQREAITAADGWFDVRDAWEFDESRIPGTTNIPLGELGYHLDSFRGKDPLVLSCLGGVRSMTAAKTLHYLGVTDAPISMSSGFRGWVEAGLDVDSRR